MLMLVVLAKVPVRVLEPVPEPILIPPSVVNTEPNHFEPPPEDPFAITKL